MLKGALVIISAPSGTGKSTVCQKLLRRRRDLRYSISCTTRSRRPGEKDGCHYHFLSVEEFKRRIQRHEFLEWAVVHGHYYGTPRHFIEQSIREGRWVLMAIDVQGAAAIRRRIPEAVLVFLVPPSWESLHQRLTARRENADTAAMRLANARAELAEAKRYDYIVVNDDLRCAVEQMECILTAESLKASRQDNADSPLLSERAPRSHSERRT